MLREGGFVDQSLGFRRQRHMHGNEIGLGENLVEGAGLYAHARDVFRGDKWIEADHFHAQTGGPFGNDAADVAETDDADGFIAELDADKFIALPLAGFERGHSLGNMARERHHQGNGMLAGGDVVAAGRVHDDDAAFGGGIGVDVLIADAGAPDDFEILRRFDQFRGDFCAAANHPAVVVGADSLKLFGLEADLDIDFEPLGIFKYR